MNCRSCGAEVGAGAAYCPSCGRPMSPVPTGHVDQMADEAAQAARDLVRAAGRLSQALLTKVEKAGHDPPGTAKRAVDKLVVELKAAKAEIDKALKDLE
jgi:hypothetical protein